MTSTSARSPPRRYSIVTVACCIPLLNYIAGPAALVLLILNLVKFHDLKNRI